MHKQRTLKHRNTQNGSKSTNNKSQTMTFWNCGRKLLFPERQPKMIDSREKRKWQLAFELQNLRVYEKCSNLNQSFSRSYSSPLCKAFLFWGYCINLQTIVFTQGTICTCCDSILSLVYSLFSLVSGYGMIMSLKQRKIRFEPRIKSNHNMN